MYKTLAILAATTAIGFASSIAAADPSASQKSEIKYKDRGGYETSATSKRTDPDGTRNTAETEVEVDVDADGDVTRRVTSERTTDPKGLMNKKKQVVETEVSEDADGDYERTSLNKKTNRDGTRVSTKTNHEVEVDADGNVVETIKTKEVVDPKGLMNKKKTVTTTKKVNGEVVDQKRDVN